MWNPFKKKEEKVEEFYKPTISITDSAVVSRKLIEQFKGEVKQEKVVFPVALGEEHPFNFTSTELLYQTVGLITGAIDKYIDFIVGPGFYVTSEDERAKEIIEKFMQDVNFDTVIRAWIKEGLIKGNGFLELGGGADEVPQGLKLLNANWMYVERDKLGVVEGYNQHSGGFKRFDKSKIIHFEPYQIAHFPFNRISDGAYGMGIIYPIDRTIANLLKQENDLHMLMNRKANVPYDVTLGKIVGDKYYKVKPADVAKLGKEFETLNNKHEWTHDALTEIKNLDFGNIGDKYDAVLKYDLDMLIFALQVPEVLMGKSVNLATAPVQLDAFGRRIQSIQAEVEKVVEQNIFSRVLEANGFDINVVHVEFEWGRPSTMEAYERLKVMTEILKQPTISRALTGLMEKEVVRLLKFDEVEYEELKEEEEDEKNKEREKEEQRQQPIVPGQQKSPAQKPPQPPTKQPTPTTAKTKAHSHSHKGVEEAFDKFKTIEEWLGFNYRQFLGEIINATKKDKFEMVMAKNVIEEKAGKLTSLQVNELKNVLDEGFREGKGMREMANMVDKRVKPKDLYMMKKGVVKTGISGLPILSKAKEKRSIAIVRSEVTRMANIGAVEHYKDNKIKKVSWVASFGPRTCPECGDLDGRVFNIDDHPDIPLHTMCRCSLVPVTELI